MSFIGLKEDPISFSMGAGIYSRFLTRSVTNVPDKSDIENIHLGGVADILLHFNFPQNSNFRALFGIKYKTDFNILAEASEKTPAFIGGGFYISVLRKF